MTDTSGLTDSQIVDYQCASAESMKRTDFRKINYNGQETVDCYGNRDTLEMCVDENDSNHDGKHFISQYDISKSNYDK